MKTIEEQLHQADEWLSKQKGGTRKIAEPKRIEVCRHPEHNVPNMKVFSPGTWEHVCPGCGNKIVFTIPEITFKS